MNKLSGYKAITLKDGTQVEVKFGMGALELFGMAVGVNTINEAMEKINPPLDENGNPVTTFEYLGNIRKLLFSAAEFACREQGKAVNFTEWSAANWIEEVGLPEIMAAMDLGSPKETSAKKKPLIKATQ